MVTMMMTVYMGHLTSEGNAVIQLVQATPTGRVNTQLLLLIKSFQCKAKFN